MADAMNVITQKRKKKPTSSPPPKKVSAPKEREVQPSLSTDFAKRKIHEARTMDFEYFDVVEFTFQNQG